MTFLAPWALAAGAGAALVVAALHFFALRRPTPAPLPTVRFVPELPAVAATRARLPADRVLLALRMLALLMVGAAFARPARVPERRPLTRVVAVDASRAVRSAAEARDSARRFTRPGDVFIAFDSAARVVPRRRGPEVPAFSLTRATGSLSAALVAALRARGAARAVADSLELVVVSPLAATEWDAATAALRALWPGEVRLVRVGARVDSAGVPRVTLTGAATDDPLRATLMLLGATSSAAAPVRLARGDVTALDSAWADSGGVLVRWPAILATSGWRQRSPSDTAGAVVVGSVVVAAAFAPTALPPEGQAVAWWADGTPAATERPLGRGCVRSVAVPVPAAGDLVLGTAMQRLLRALTAPCGAVVSSARATSAGNAGALARLAGQRGMEPGTEPGTPRTVPAAPWRMLGAPVSAWLLALAAAVLALELGLRRRGRTAS